MKERIEFPKSIESDMKIAKSVASTHLTRDEVIARALDNFLRRWGF